MQLLTSTNVVTAFLLPQSAFGITTPEAVAMPNHAGVRVLRTLCTGSTKQVW